MFKASYILFYEINVSKLFILKIVINIFRRASS
jgi:hypothetical protein